ncbi:NAD(P)H-dependent FMN reductase [Rhodobacteraceae bacterium MBR-64]|jgi:NAD(P)H-dependent FMN reductase
MAPKLHVVICSTRPGRIGGIIAEWFQGIAAKHPGFDAELVDLATFNLPVYDEPRHPRLKDYAHDHTKAWSARVEAADAFVFVTPEYNFGPPPSLVNALTYLSQEWAYKPAAFVSYGGISGGMRAVQAIKPTLNTLKMVPITEAVVAPMVFPQIKDGVFTPNDLQVESASVLLDELARWAGALAALRA